MIYGWKYGDALTTWTLIGYMMYKHEWTILLIALGAGWIVNMATRRNREGF